MSVKNRRKHHIVDTIWPDGKRTRRQAASEDQAKKLDLRIRASRVDGTWPELREQLFGRNLQPQDLTLRELVDLYKEDYCKTYNRSMRSKTSRLKIVQRIIGKDTPVSLIDAVALARLAKARRAEGASNATINKDISALHHMISWGVSMRYVERDPVAGWRRLQEIEFVGQRPTEEIIEAVLAKLHPVVRPLYEFFHETGCRRGEGLDLQHWQVDIPHRVVTFAKTKNARGRQVPLTERAVRAIQAMPRTTTDYVFYHPVSLTRWSEARKPWEKARKEAGHPWLRVHDLRHHADSPIMPTPAR